ncbi:MAG: hypothetical protein VX733_15340 [Candidatus Latescibacterota bacterium]|nr:hypothetical protein [Candidatus Latescibacterota bacterium]
MTLFRRVVALAVALPAVLLSEQIPETPLIHLPYLEDPPAIDGDLSEWRDRAFTDGVWDISRLRHTPWFQAWRNRLTDHGTEPPPDEDLATRYYTAWDDEFLYMGAESRDNVNDADDPEHEDKRWYFKDSICWFVEAPRDEAPERFAQGDNAFCFVIDESRPGYAAWWRHGTPGETYVEEPIPVDAVNYVIRMNPWGESDGDFILEARVNMAATMGVSDPQWQPPQTGHVYSLEIVQCDPDGGPYGGHFILYGTGDDDQTWGRAVLVGPLDPIERLPK